MLHNNNNSKIKSIGCFIFGGSQTIGHLKAGWNVDRILEMTEDMPKANSAHFVKNYPDIPVIKPSEWESEGYLTSLKGQYDLLFANNPCSGLSRLNQWARIDSSANVHFYNIFKIIEEVEPKIFLIENAPTLVSIGTPILKKMVETIESNYRFTIIRDKAGNHGVCMPRMRTFVIGWNKKYFSKIPLVKMNHENPVFVEDVLNKSLDGIANCEKNKKNPYYYYCNELESFYQYIRQDETLLRASIRTYVENNDKFQEKWKAWVDKCIKKIEAKKHKPIEYEKDSVLWNGGIFDKSPFRLNWKKQCPSMTSLSVFIHPSENRELYIREYARIMGYPDEFVFYQDDSTVSCIQACAQGVPVNFIWYISKELRRIIENKDVEYSADESKTLVFQHHIVKRYVSFTDKEFQALEGNLVNVCDGKNISKLTK